ncbi:Uncharacterised protein [Clostridium paraputrificum]|uniref:hypothetical protein n=1 Tax=Clostridium paraputrificum TaxID=29363 RepID=UPI0006687DD5|nr:hypothetical protein [Clostridium paraputrificum]CUQ09264.1 Uncharacterised protein [Clostridium paraputrificum]
MRKIGKIISMVLILFILWDAFFNNMILLTKFIEWFLNIYFKVLGEFSKWYTEKVMGCIS